MFEDLGPLSLLRACEHRVVASIFLEHFSDLADPLRGVSRAKRLGNQVVDEFEVLVNKVIINKDKVNLFIFITGLIDWTHYSSNIYGICLYK